MEARNPDFKIMRYAIAAERSFSILRVREGMKSYAIKYLTTFGIYKARPLYFALLIGPNYSFSFGLILHSA
jgi:hypothetical protein